MRKFIAPVDDEFGDLDPGTRRDSNEEAGLGDGLPQEGHVEQDFEVRLLDALRCRRAAAGRSWTAAGSLLGFCWTAAELLLDGCWTAGCRGWAAARLLLECRWTTAGLLLDCCWTAMECC